MFWISWVLVLPGVVNAIGSPHYECGEHGRFEYCIDDIPGCIVGCHCHPGFYFDTDTKICEPNAKLVLEFRRLYGEQSPTRVPRIYLPDNPLAPEPTPTPAPAPAALDDQVESIAKESDDLGDWLYNQFFKTIESQVISNADNVTDIVKSSRRSGDLEMPKRQPKTQTGKKGKSSRKNTKNKTDLRRKLLRITEDDSLFDSSSGSSEDSSSSASSSNDSSGDGSRERAPGQKNTYHPHRRILMINKKPKPPLPSFIFLPQLQTPFYPPIGLPPPAFPMYPMVPVPPMFVPGQQNKPCAQTTASPENKDSDDKKKKGKSDDTTTTATTTPADESVGTSTVKPGPAGRMLIHRANKHAQRKKILKQLQERMQNSKMSGMMGHLKKLRRPLAHKPPFEIPTANEAFPPLDPNEMPPTPGGDVDFKYLGQLIHKIDNKTGGPILPINGLPEEPLDPSIFQHKESNFHPNGPPFFPPDFPHDGSPNISPPLNKLENSPPNNEEHTRRFGNINELTDSYNNNKNRRFLESPNEQYYSKLGQQIAGLIRKVDSNSGYPPVDIEIQRNEPPAQSVFIENDDAPRSYWERSVRSLLKQYRPYMDNTYRQSNYQDSLFNLETRVETLATTTKPLSLPELENFVFLIDKTKTTYQQTTATPDEMFTEIDNENLNVNLLAKQNEQEFIENSNIIPYNFNEYSESNVGRNEKENKYHKPEVEDKLHDYQNTNTDIKHDNYEQQKNEMKSTNYVLPQLTLDPYKDDQKKIQKVNNYNLPPNTEQNLNNYGYFELMPNFRKGKTYNNSEVLSRLVAPNNLRSLLLNNIKTINPLPKHLSYNMKEMSISNKDFMKNPMIKVNNHPMFGTLQMKKQNKTLLKKIKNNKITKVKPQQMAANVGTNRNTVAQVWKKPSHLPWNLPGIGDNFANTNVYRISNKRTNPLQQPINIQVQLSPKMTFRTIKDYGDKIRSRLLQEPRQVLPMQMLAQETNSKLDSPLFQHHLVHHYDGFN